MADPLVSCLCVSRPSRWGQLQRAIHDFAFQTYAERQLVVVVDSVEYESTVRSFVDQAQWSGDADRVRVHRRYAKTQLEGLLHAAGLADGDILALWDDDNTNHPDRLRVQVGRQVNSPRAATALSQSLYHFHDTNELFAVDYERPDAPVAWQVASSTLMAYRRYWPPTEPQMRPRPSEGMAAACARDGRSLVRFRPGRFLHCVGVTHDNLRGYDAHRRVAQDRGLVAARLAASALVPDLDGYRWDADKIDVEGSDAGAFEYPAKQKWPAGLYPIASTAPETKG